MDLNHLSAKQQWLILIVLAAILSSPYAMKRFWPAYKTLQKNHNQLASNQNTILNPNYPESPDVDEEDVRSDIEEVQTKVDNLSSQTDTLQSRIAPVDSQDVLLELSAVAKVNNISIIENLPYVVQRVATNKNTQSNVIKKSPTGRMDSATRAQRRAVRAMNRSGASSLGGKSIVGTIPREGELIYDVVNNLDEARPLQLMTLQGTYFGLMGFIETIRNMPVQVTILNINIDTQVQIAAQTPQNMQGLPQLIRVSLIVAL